MHRRQLLWSFLGCAFVPKAAIANIPKHVNLAYLSLTPEVDHLLLPSFKAGLREFGFSEGQGVTLRFSTAHGRAEQLPKLASDIAATKPDVIIAGFGTLTAQAAAAATKSIPIVFTTVGDPVGAGIVSSLGRPGGNITGMSAQLTDIGGKRLELLREIIPAGQAVAVLRNPATPATRLSLREIEQYAKKMEVRLIVEEITRPEGLEQKISQVKTAGAAGLIVLEDPFLLSLRHIIANVAIKIMLPTIFGDRIFAESGGLISYGPDRRQIFRRAAYFVARIINGATPSELAVEQPIAFELVINATTARAIRLLLPPNLLARAHEVID